MPNTSDIDKISQIVQFSRYKTTRLFQRYVRLPHKIKGIFSGNQSFKTSATAFQYVMRVLGTHPVPKFNVLYFECEKRVEIFDNVEDHDVYRKLKESYLKIHKSNVLIPLDSGTFSIKTRPEDNICPECGGKIVVHKRKTRIIRFASETLPTEKGGLEGDTIQSAEVRNTQYPEFKKWCPPFLIKKDNITVRNSVLTLFDPNANMMFGELKHVGADIVIEFSGYNQAVQAGAGVQRLSCVAKGQRVLMNDGVWREIEKIKAGDELICEALGGYGDRQKTNKVKKAWYSGSKEVLRFDCQKGISFEVTGDHLVMVPVLGKPKYIRADQLKVGDNVTCRISDIEGSGNLGWKSAIIGILLGDGTITKKQTTPKFTCKNGKIAKELEKILPENIYLRKQVFKNDHADDYFICDTTQSKNEIKDLLKDIGVWGCRAKNMFVPDIIFRQNLKGIAIFLSFIYSCDGWASGHQIGYCSISERLADDIRFLLRRFGIRSTVYEKEFTNGWSKQWHIIIAQYKDVIRFIDNIGIICKEEAVSEVRVEAKRRMKSSMERSGFCGKKPCSRIKPSVVIKEITPIGIKRVYDISMETGGWDTREKNGVKTQRKVARSPRNNFLISGGVVVHNCWLDEEAPLDFYEEQFPRLLAEDGDLIITVTPANGLSWSFDDIFEKAKIIIRTPTICKYYLEEEGKVVKEIEHTDSGHDIAVIQSATDDNPTLSPDVVEAMYNEMPDLDGTAIATRRYGIFKQATGRIFKDMNYKVHVIDPRIYSIGPEYINGMVLARTFDFHPANPHAIIWAGLSPSDELFIYREWKPSPDKWVISRLCRQMAIMSTHEKYICNLIDPLANTANQETGKSTVELMNESFLELRRDGLGTGGYWEPFNTKGEVGRDSIKERLHNSLKVERPFNNKVTEDGKTKILPTIWIFKECRDTARSLKQWRLESWASNRQLATRDKKEKHAEKWSHFCTALEGLLKDKRFRPKRSSLKPKQREYKRFQGGRR